MLKIKLLETMGEILSEYMFRRGYLGNKNIRFIEKFAAFSDKDLEVMFEDCKKQLKNCQ